MPDCSSSSFKNSKPTERETSAPQHNRLFLNRESVEGGCWLHRTTDVTVVTMTRTRFATVRPLHPCSSLEHPHAQPQTASVSRAPPPLEPLPCLQTTASYTAAPPLLHLHLHLHLHLPLLPTTAVAYMCTNQSPFACNPSCRSPCVLAPWHLPGVCRSPPRLSIDSARSPSAASPLELPVKMHHDCWNSAYIVPPQAKWTLTSMARVPYPESSPLGPRSQPHPISNTPHTPCPPPPPLLFSGEFHDNVKEGVPRYSPRCFARELLLT